MSAKFLKGAGLRLTYREVLNGHGSSGVQECEDPLSAGLLASQPLPPA